VYPKGWWAQNAEVDEYEQAYIQGVDQTYETFLGTFIGASDNYVITGHIATQSCPNIDNANKTDTQKADMLCELPNIAKDTVFPTFQSLNE